MVGSWVKKWTRTEVDMFYSLPLVSVQERRVIAGIVGKVRWKVCDKEVVSIGGYDVTMVANYRGSNPLDAYDFLLVTNRKTRNKFLVLWNPRWTRVRKFDMKFE